MPEASNSRNRSSSLEGATLMDDQQQRKRPRLDSAEAGATEASLALKETSPNDMDPHRSPSPSPIPPSIDMARSPTSKVTINTRSIQSPAQPCSQETSISEPQAPTNDIDVAMMPEPSPGTAQNEAISISSSSSAANSPEIQVAEVEDFDQDESETRWQPLSGDSRIRLDSRYVYQTFPYAIQATPTAGRVGRLIPQMSNVLTQEECDGLLHELEAWLSGLVDLQDQITPDFLTFEPGFWATFPDLISAILRRDRAIGPRFSAGILKALFLSYGRLLRRLIQLDIDRLRTNPSETSNVDDLLSRQYLQAMGWILQPSDIPLYSYFLRSQTLDPIDLTSPIIDELVGDGTNILHLLTELTVELKNALPKKTPLGISLLHIVKVGLQFVKSKSERLALHAASQYRESHCLDGMLAFGYELFAKADDVLQLAITKQQPWLNIENAPEILRVFGSAYSPLGAEIEGLGAELVQVSGVVSETFSVEETKLLTAHAWKMKTLRKLIVNGRMELRVWGVAEMQLELITVYKGHVQEKDIAQVKRDTLVRFLVAFIRDTRLIEYIIGVDSHPQLISRSPNIVGFLSVTGTYHDSDTDIMWHTVTESEDPRIVREVIKVLTETANISSLPALLHYCTTLLNLPVDRYNLPLVEYAGDILDRVGHKIETQEGRSIDDSRPLQLCIHLLRHASVPGVCSIEVVPQIRETVHRRFPRLLSACGGEQEKHQLWSQCIADVTADNEFATGSIEAIGTWSAWAATQGRMLEVQSDLTEILVKNIVHFAASCEGKASNDLLALKLAFEIRLSTLARLIVNQAETITPKLLEILWDGVFTSPSAPTFIHTTAWDTLTSVIKCCGLGSNMVIDSLVKDYLPKLRPSDFDTSCLNFMEHAMECEMQAMEGELPEKAGVLVLPGADRIERVMLQAPSNTIESEAADFIITKYLDHKLVTKRTSSEVRDIHMALVDRCVREVIVAASLLKSYTDGTTSGEDEPMVIIAPEQEIHAAEMRFYRWLLFLRKFLKGMKARPVYSPKTTQSRLPLDGFERKGEGFESAFQVYKSSHMDSTIHKFVLGRDNTGAELWQYLADVTGFERFRTLNGGRDIELKGVEKSLSEIRLQSGVILVIRNEGSPEKMPQHSARASSPVDSTVMNNFGELYALLDLDERLAKEIFGFLCLFPPQSAVVESIRSMTASSEDLLPVDKPYRLLYCAQALRSCLEAESLGSSPDSELLQYGVKTITSVMPQLGNAATGGELRNLIAKSLLEALLLALRAKVAEDVSLSYFEHPGKYVAQLLEMLDAAIICEQSDVDTSNPIFEPFEALLEGALHDERLWPYITTNVRTSVLLRQLLLVDKQPQNRKHFSKLFCQLSGPSSTKIIVKFNDPRAARSRFPPEKIETALANLWTLLAGEVKYAEQFPTQSQELFESSAAVFRRVSKNLPIPTLKDLFQHWSSMLGSHHHNEIVGRPSNDNIIPGLTKLLQECCKVLRTENADIESSDLSSVIFSKFLFPFSKIGNDDRQSGMPVLSGTVREDLYDLVLELNNEMDSLPQVLKSLTNTVHKDSFESHTTNDRLALRSEVGYAGLRNLANTCYLNSLFSNLFMNVRFREMIIHASVVDEAKQPLLIELGKVFSRMQNSYRKWIDPTLAVENIVNYDSDRIDVAIQMDVDEFYNLLFDRLEWQFLVPAEKETLKSLYGGQLVQQIKSRDCDHISETFENFTTVQLEIRGKRGLEDSLRAYVEGEILQGDNKYKCSQCDRHVDAVKRACLKDVPNNLIFNLKRFDYDIMTGMRAKVNDEFAFPECIDMAPYTIDALSQPEKGAKSDVFELVGVIVHTGTADSGHYYSFTRQRPSSKDKKEAWVQFNDSEVNVFDLETLKENCFGGVNDFNFSKIYSAYMLFYERTSSIQKLEQTFANADPVRIPLLTEVEQEIEEDNHSFLQSYCIQDPSHARFLKVLLERMRSGPSGRCSQNHLLEADLMVRCLEYVQQVSSRWKEHPEVEATLEAIIKYAEQCKSCAYVVIKWYVENDALRDNVIRSPSSLTRKFFKVVLYRALQNLRGWYTLPSEEQSGLITSSLGDQTPQELFASCVGVFGKQWEYLPKFARAWEDYFELLRVFVNLGSFEMLRFLEDGLLERLLEIVLAHVGPVRKDLKDTLKTFLQLKDRGRHFGLQNLLETLEKLLEIVDIATVQDEPRDLLPDGRFTVNAFEAKLLGSHPNYAPKPKLEWLNKAIIGRENPISVCRIVGKLAQSTPTSKWALEVLNLGVNDAQIRDAVNFLDPIIAFCEQCHDEVLVEKMMRLSLEAVYSIGTQYNRDHLDFVKSMLKTENRHIEWDQREFRKRTIFMVGKWAPPLLLSPPSSRDNVSDETFDLVKHFLWVENSPEIRRDASNNVRKLTLSGIEYIRDNILANGKDGINLQPRQSENLVRILEPGIRRFEQTDGDTAQGERQLARMQEIMELLNAKQEAADQAVETIGSPDWVDGTSDSDALEVLSDNDISHMMTPSPTVHDV
jgi:ubiquitin carboxyl-terminal hydrolase 34